MATGKKLLMTSNQEYECDRCLGIIPAGELHEYTFVKEPPELKSFGLSTYTICHFHNYECKFYTGPEEEKPDMYDLQEQDLKNIKRHGQSNNLI